MVQVVYGVHLVEQEQCFILSLVVTCMAAKHLGVDSGHIGFDLNEVTTAFRLGLGCNKFAVLLLQDIGFTRLTLVQADINSCCETRLGEINCDYLNTASC